MQAGEGQVGYQEEFLPWKGLVPHPWMWHSVLWGADKVGIWHRLDSMSLEVFAKINDPVIL